ncbi:MAG: ribosome biogenesis protein [Nanoarchaeota archaeon]|nr:ribosome biogenesis protein [Nanoarchaeota archaeon]
MIHYCEKCEEYTLKEVCSKCRNKTVNRKPARFNPNKNYAKERLKVKGFL